MIKGVHAMFYAPNADELRAFIRDKLGLHSSDVGDGWLIFDVPEGEVGCHPAEARKHGVSFYCDDINETVEQLKSRGVEFAGPVSDQGWGLVATIRMPGGGEVELYEPQYRKDPRG